MPAEETNITEESNIKPEDIHMPPNSYWPIILAFGLSFIMAGLAFSLSLIVTGVIISLVATVGWVIEPGYSVEDH